MSVVNKAAIGGVVLAFVAASWSGCGGGDGGALCTSFVGFSAAYDFSTDCMGGTVTGRFSVYLPSTSDGLPDAAGLSAQARAGGLNADLSAAFSTAVGQNCNTPREAGDDPRAVIAGIGVNVYPVALEADRTGVVPYNCGAIGRYDDTMPADRPCSRSVCQPAGGCEMQRCTLTVRRR